MKNKAKVNFNDLKKTVKKMEKNEKVRRSSLDKRLERWINSVPFVKNADIKVYIENGNTGIKPRINKTPAEYQPQLFDRICDMVFGARLWEEEK